MTAKRILVFQTAFLGDAVLSIPLLKAIKRNFAGAELGFVCRQGVGELFTATGLVDHVFEVDKRNGRSLSETFRRTRAFHPNVVISPHRSFRTALWVWRLMAPVTVGFKDLWTFFAYKKRVKRPDGLHDVIRQLSLMEAFGVKLPAEASDASSNVSEDEILSLNVSLSGASPEKFSKFKNFVALSPGSQWNTKRWAKEGFIEVGKKFLNQGLDVMIVGAPNERALCEEIAQALPGATNLCGKTSILELAQILARAKILICNDSGAMHVATLVATPVVSIFGATVPGQGYAPWSENARVVEVELGCRPCGAHGHDECPLGHHRCMTQVTPDQVWAAVQELRL